MHAAFAPLRLGAAPLVLVLTLACSADPPDEVVDLPTRALSIAAPNRLASWTPPRGGA